MCASSRSRGGVPRSGLASLIYTTLAVSGLNSVIFKEFGAYAYYGVVDLLIDFFLDVTSLSPILTAGLGLAELPCFDV